MGVTTHPARPGLPLAAWLAWLDRWRYDVAGKRDLRIDFLRGFAVFAMVIDHIGGDSPLYLLTGGNRFFVSAAEGFVFISGAMVGLVYRGELARGGMAAVTLKALKRAWTLYALSVWLALAFGGVSALLRLPWAPELAGGGWAAFVLGVVTTRRTFYLVDVMLLYTFLLALAPLALWALKRGRTWEMLCVSYGVWFAYQVFPDRLKLPWPIADSPVFNLAAWQLLFFTGLLLGYHRERVGAWLAARPRPPLPGGWLLPLGVGVGGLIWLQATTGAALDRFAPDGDGGALLDIWFDKSMLPLPRLLASGLIFAFLWTLTTELWAPLARALGPLLQSLGSRALYAYTAHLFIIAGLHFASMRLTAVGAMPLGGPGADEAAGAHLALPGLVNAALQLGGIALLWLLTRYQVLYRAVLPLGQPPVRAVAARVVGVRSVRQDVARPAPAWLARFGLSCLRPTASLVAIGVVLLAGATGLAAGSPGWANTAQAGQEVGTSDGPTAASRPRVQTTVTAPRRVGQPKPGASSVPAPASSAPLVPAAEIDAPSPVGDAAPLPVEEPVLNPLLPVVPGGGVEGALAGLLSDEEFESAAMGHTMPFAVYLPPGYDATDRHYPVLYMLHGAGGHYSEWVDFGLTSTADRLMASGEIQPFIIVLPQGDQSYWINWADGGPRWADYVANDLVDYIDANYRTIQHRRARAVGGLSMGGYGALTIAFRNLDRFSVAGAHSPSLRGFDQALPFMGEDEATFDEQDPISLAKNLPRRRLAVWVDVGEDDQWRPSVETLHTIFHDRGLPHDFRVFPGDHEYTYWIAHVDTYVRFYAENLHGE